MYSPVITPAVSPQAQRRTAYAGLDGRVVLVTGACGGLGQALATAFTQQGSRLVISDIDAARLQALRHQLGAECVAVEADLSDAEACADLVLRAVDTFGRLDALVNNAAVLSRLALEEITPEHFDHVMAVNLRAPFFLAQAALRSMRDRGFGRIVNVASMAARTGGGDQAYLYASSKGGLVAMTKALARLGAPLGVLVNAILPANIDTSMLQQGFDPSYAAAMIKQIPLGRLAVPAEVAELVLWLASDASSYVTGASYEIAGGWLM